MSPVIHVAAAAIVNKNNELLISRRAENLHQGGLWEFPGGKLEANEAVEHALLREIDEELGIRLKAYRPLIKVRHDYEDKSVLLDVWAVTDYTGLPEGREGQLIRWQNIEQLDADEFPAADVAVIQALKLPEHYMISGRFGSAEEFERRIGSALDRGIRLIQLRLTHDWLRSANLKLGRQVKTIAETLSESYGARLMLNIPDELHDVTGAACLHLNSRKLNSYITRPDCELLSASCHDAREINRAIDLAADFIVLSPVQPTSSHPDARPLGWNRFAEMTAQVNVPVYALGGVTRQDTEKAWQSGAQGVAAIGAFWNEDEL